MKIKTGQLQTRAAFVPSTFNEEAGTVELVWTTGARGKRTTWDGDVYYEELEVSDRAVNLSRLNNKAPLLNSHRSYGIESVLGVIERAWIAGNEGRALVRFSKRAEVQAIKSDVRDGIITHTSVGYGDIKYKRLEETVDGAPIFRAVQWTPGEISLVPMGFDDQATVRAQETDSFFDVEVVEEVQTRAMPAQPEVKQMEETKDAAPATTGVDVKAVREEATKEERQRAAGIRFAVRAAKLDDKFADELIDGGKSIDAAREAVIAKLAQSDAAKPETDNKVRIEVGKDVGRESLREGAVDAILARVAPAAFKVTENGRRFRGLRLMEIARRFVDASGADTQGMAPMELASRALGLETRGGMHSTSDFPLVLADVANKTLRKGYEEAPQTFQAIARQGAPLVDFKPVYRVQLGDAPDLEEVLEGGTVKRGTIGEGRESYQLASYSKIVGFTRKALINDDLGAFERIAQLFGRAARDLESDLVWEQITSNPTMGDSVVLFHTASHANLAGSGAVISVTTIGAGRKAMRIQTGINGRRLNLVPKVLVVPASLETTAEQFLSTNFSPATNTEKNVFAGRLQLVVEPRLDTASATAYYLFADPGQIDTVEYAYLDGEQGPRMETRVGFDVEGMELKCSHDFAAKALDHRGMYKNPGA